MSNKVVMPGALGDDATHGRDGYLRRDDHEDFKKMPPWDKMRFNRPRKLVDPDKIRELGDKYMEWVEDNPMEVEKILARPKSPEGFVRVVQKKPRAATMNGICLTIGISIETWYRTLKDPNTSTEIRKAMRDVAQRIHEYGVSNTAAELQNVTIMTRVLGLAEKSINEIEVTDASTVPAVDEDALAVHMHPDDPYVKTGDLSDGVWPRPLFSKHQLDAGIPFFLPAKKDDDDGDS